MLPLAPLLTLLAGDPAVAAAPEPQKPQAEPIQDVLLLSVPAPAVAAVARSSGAAAAETACVLSPCAAAAACRGGSTACRELTCPEIAWRVCLQDKGLKGLWVGPVDLKTSPEAPWTRVLYEAGPAEVFVPYHHGAARIYDLQTCAPPAVCLRQVDPADAGRHGELVTLSADLVPKVVAEVRDRGVAWLCKWGEATSNAADGSIVRRGEELLLWGVYDAGNYDYLLQYGFRDDGVISLRLGATGYNHESFPEAAHMHDVLWYVDVDLDGADLDTAYDSRHEEGLPSPLEATDGEAAFNDGVEGGLAWDPELFRTVLVEDASTNAHGSRRGYELVPFRAGTARHHGADERFTRADFWVTRWTANTSWMTDWQPPDEVLFGSADGRSGIADRQPIEGQDLVLWHLSSAHHAPHDEDQAQGGSGFEGVTLIHWTGADLVPHHLFDHNPLGGPHRDQCKP